MACGRGEHDLARARDELIAARDHMMQTVAHEVRTPLAVIRGCAELLGRFDGPADPRLVRALVAASDRLEATVAAVTNAAADGSDHLTPQRVVVDEVVAGAVAGVAQPDAAARVRVQGGARDVQVDTDPDKLGIALSCVLDNALRFSPPATDVTVAINPNAPHGAEVLVQDRGIGIPQEFVPTAFEPFTQADASPSRRFGGLGIGLYTTRTLLHQLGGDIEIRDTGPHGTLVAIRVPAVLRRHRSTP